MAYFIRIRFAPSIVHGPNTDSPVALSLFSSLAYPDQPIMFASRAFASSSRVAFRNKSSLPQRALQALRDSTKGNDAANKAKGATSGLDKKVKFAAPKPVLDTKLGNLKETPVGASSIKVEEVRGVRAPVALHFGSISNTKTVIARNNIIPYSP